MTVRRALKVKENGAKTRGSSFSFSAALPENREPIGFTRKGRR